MSMSISIKKFRSAIDQVEDPRASVIIKTAYLLAARNSEVVTKTSPWDLLHNASKPYGNFMKFGFQDFEVNPQKGDKPAEYEKVFVVTCAVAKRGKRLKTPKPPMDPKLAKAYPKDREAQIAKVSMEHKEMIEEIGIDKAEVIEALTKYKQIKLLRKWQEGEVEIDPLLIKVLLGKIVLKVVALPTHEQYEPWTIDLLHYIKKHGNINFNMTRQRLWQILRENLSGILPKKGKHNIKNPLRHFRIAHLIEYYQMDPYEITSYTGWTARSTFGQLGIQASPNIDFYSHLRWRLYFPKLLKPISQFK